ncbi:hypothetical protein AAC387_Pa09g0696 [Persea americana]
MQLNVLNFSVGESQMQKPQPSPNKMDQPSLEPDWTKATWTHIAWVATGCTLVLLSLARSAIMAAKTDMWLEPLLAALLGYVLADLATGIFHWSVDNYGDINTPIFGGVIDSFQGHHDAPWSITERDVANNLHELGRGATTGLLIAHLLSNDATVHGFVSVFGACGMFCQQFHAWSHTPKKALPKLVLALQDMGVLISRKDHALHHQQPFNSNYCIVSGIWNQFLDEYKVCEGMEMVVFYLTGVRPRSWMEPKRVD